jgi:hypothetical protein
VQAQATTRQLTSMQVARARVSASRAVAPSAVTGPAGPSSSTPHPERNATSTTQSGYSQLCSAATLASRSLGKSKA